MAQNPTSILRLEDFLHHIWATPVQAGTLFTELCVQLLKAMGFTDLHVRKGSESGRDVDASYAGKTWYFECKNYSRNIDTPQMAYKFLQLDLLPSQLRPDFFVLLSNASMTSILKDIVEFRRADRNVRYSIEVWTNEPNDPIFDKILLSYPDIYIDFVRKNVDTRRRKLSTLISDFKERSHRYLETNPSFFERYRNGMALLRSSLSRPPKGDLVSFLLDDALKSIRNANMGIGWAELVIGCPVRPLPGMYDFEDIQTRSMLSEMLIPWRMVEMSRSHPDFVTFHEAGGHDTLLFDYGAIVTISEVSARDGCIAPYEWLKALREDCLRMRNYAKRGMLITPTVFRAYVTCLDRPLSGSDREELIYIGGLQRFLPDFEQKEPNSRYDIRIQIDGVRSDDVTFTDPPEENDELGRPLAVSLWSNMGRSKPLLLEAEEIERKLHEAWKKNEPNSISGRYFMLGTEFGESFYWLRGETSKRPYDDFREAAGLA